MFFRALPGPDQIITRIAGWQALATKPIDQPIDLAGQSDTLKSQGRQAKFEYSARGHPSESQDSAGQDTLPSDEEWEVMDVSVKSDDQSEAPIASVASRKCILVAGTHRSGTSALTRVLSLLGAALPKQVMGAGPFNEKGHWEPERLVALHDAMFAEASTLWNDWRAFDPATLGPERLAHYKDQMVRIISEEYGDATLFIVKDPRVCRMVPLWREVLDQVGAQALFVIPLRNPIEVARSLEKRDGLPLGHACLLWLRDVLDAEHWTRGTPRVFVHYADLLRDPVRTALQITSQLAVDWPAVSEETEREISSFVDLQLRHHVAELEELSHPAPFYPWVSETYEAYSMLVRRPADGKAQRRLDRVRAAFDPACASFAPLFAVLEGTLRERDRKIATLDQAQVAHKTLLSERDEKIAALDQVLAARARALGERDEKIAALDQALTERQRVVGERNEKIAALDQALAERERALAERDEKVATLDRMLAARADEVAALKQVIEERNVTLADVMTKLAFHEAAIGALYASTSWRITAPLRAARRLLRLR